MKHMIISAAGLGLVIALSSCATKNGSDSAGVPVSQAPGRASAQAEASSGPDYSVPASSDWPRTFSNGTTSYTVYEPVVDSWDGHALIARSAVAVQSPGRTQPTYGVINLNAFTLVDKSTRTVSLENVRIVSGNFPSDRAQTPGYLAALRDHFPKQIGTLPLDALEAGLNAVQPKTRTGPLNNAPPKIIFSTRPAILVSIDGPAAYRMVAGTGLLRVLNTRVLLLKDPAGQFYLHYLDGYLEAPALDGPWSVAARPPIGAAVAEQQARESQQVDLLEGQPGPDTGETPSLHTSPLPAVYVATAPTELITFNGEPQFVAIAGADLLYVANTSGNVFQRTSDQHTYVLIAGRWFRAPSLKGPWQFVPGNRLPHDFAEIPDSSLKENVKASVPGTRQAEEALIDNSIPETAAVPRATEMAASQFDGPPKLEPIPGTPLHYVVNSDTPVIEVDGRSWYACQNGVWFASTSVNGPWIVAASIPAVIGTIPVTSLLHYLTYAQVYDSTPDVVYEGYTPGYLGTEVADDGTVVYGTGYWYPPWIGTYWFGPPFTWGFGWDCCWTPWWGWGFGVGFGWDCGLGGFGWRGCYPPAPWWGAYRHWGFFHDRGGLLARGRLGGVNTAANVYGRQAFRTGSPQNAILRNGPSDNYGRAYNSRTGQLAAGQRGRVRNVYNSGWAPRGNSGFARTGGFATPNRGVLLRNGNGGFTGAQSMSRPGLRYDIRANRPRIYSSPRFSDFHGEFTGRGFSGSGRFESDAHEHGFFHGGGGGGHGGGEGGGRGGGGGHGGGGGGGHGGGGR
jgi:hypothetical protein